MEKLLKANIRGEGGFCLKWPIVFLLKHQATAIRYHLEDDGG